MPDYSLPLTVSSHCTSPNWDLRFPRNEIFHSIPCLSLFPSPSRVCPCVAPFLEVSLWGEGSCFRATRELLSRLSGWLANAKMIMFIVLSAAFSCEKKDATWAFFSGLQKKESIPIPENKESRHWREVWHLLVHMVTTMFDKDKR